MSMASRIGVAILLVALAVVASASARSSAPGSVYTIQGDPRMCPSPLCGGYWVALANGVRTRCADGHQAPRCYVAKAVDQSRRPVTVPTGGLVRATLEPFDEGELGKLGVVVVSLAYEPAGTAPVSGGYYRVRDNGVRCIRAPCFSYRAEQVNGSARVTTSGLDLAASGATPAELTRANAALRTKNGLLARGRFATTPDGGRLFRASRMFLRAPLPRA
jgi:hypothetical protein